MRSRNTLALAVSLAFAAGCSDATPLTAPVDRTPPVDAVAPLAALTCTASIPQGTVACASPGASGEGAAHVAGEVIFGGQDRYVRLATTGTQVVADTFMLDVTVQNLLPQPIGTVNGITAHANGVRVFFGAGPTGDGGAVSVANADGVGTFTQTGQPYFQYAQRLASNEVSLARRWKLRFAPGVTQISFTVSIAAEVQFPTGYVADVPYVLALDPGETRTLTGTVRTFRGDSAPVQTITWTTANAGVAAVTGAQVTAGLSRGVTALTATAGAVPPLHPTAVSVCQSTPVAHNTVLAGAIASSDCFSTFGSASGQPTSSYYGDLYRVNLTAGQTIVVTMDTGDDLDSYLILAHGSTGAIMAWNDDDDTGTLGVGSRVEYTAPVSGTYVIEASTFNGLDTGAYTLRVTIN